MNTIELMKVMSSPVKAKIVLRLFECSCVNSTVNDLCKDFNLKQPNVSKHFMDLRNKGIVDFLKKGKEIIYFITPEFKKNNDKILSAILERAVKEDIITLHCKKKSIGQAKR
ncbi:MAG: winged helix-turn-helix transcriptional regulator [Mycoplasmatales bacterium]|nr:winged helix-turn-helix transcriptional regulator [Mycoplasmatales bacterium]